MEYDYHEAMKVANQICFPLYAAARNVTGLYTPYLKPLGLTYTQYLVFLVLWEKDGVSVSRIGENLMLDNGTLSPLLKKLEQEGYIERRRSVVDDRGRPRPAGKGEGCSAPGGRLHRPFGGKGFPALLPAQ